MDTSTKIHGLEDFAKSYSVVLTYPANSQRISGLSIGEAYPVLNQVMILTDMQVVDDGNDRVWQLQFEPAT